MARGAVPTAGEVAAAVAAACTLYGVAPLMAFDATTPARRVRRLAGGALLAAGRASSQACASVLGLHANSYWPSQWAGSGITRGEVDRVIAALPPPATAPDVGPPAAVAPKPAEAAKVAEAPRMPAPLAPEPRGADAIETISLRPVRGPALAFALRFVDARWDVGEVAWLFDFDERELRAALRKVA